MRQEGAFSGFDGDIPKGFDVDEFSSAFVRFENGASLIIEVSWLLHHGTEMMMCEPGFVELKLVCTG